MMERSSVFSIRIRFGSDCAMLSSAVRCSPRRLYRRLLNASSIWINGMRSVKDLIFNNWMLKVFSFILAFALWAAVAGESTSEIGIEVPLEYRNVPTNSEIVGDGVNTVEVRL